ncbi:MAG: hypothetical protein LC808_05500, partial [Actinobacteria bacterium]|nr:hypothetical protein [Actinomycetota bacterium]
VRATTIGLELASLAVIVAWRKGRASNRRCYSLSGGSNGNRSSPEHDETDGRQQRSRSGARYG